LSLTPEIRLARLRRAGFYSLAVAALLLPTAAMIGGQAAAQAPAASAENTGPNKNIASRSHGSFARRGILENWHRLEHTDGSNTWLIWRADAIARKQVDAVFRTDSAGKPLAGLVRENPRAAQATVDFARDRWPAAAHSLLTWPILQSGRAAAATKNGARRGLSSRQLAAAGIARWAKGRYAYTTLQDGRPRGHEDFYMTAHVDGSRSLTMWHDIFARHSQFSVSLGIDPGQRPRNAFVSYWTAEGYKGSTFIQVDGANLTADHRGATGDRRQVLQAPGRFSIGTHPVAGDGWHTVSCDSHRDPEGKVQVYTMEATADLQKPMLGQLTNLPCEPLGEERITVPAGTFDTLRYRLAGVNDVWITRQDRIMVKFVSARLDRAYILTEFYGAGFTQNQLRK
jgi:hypothetical protein